MHISRPLTRPQRRSAARKARFSAMTRERNRRANLSEDAATYTCACGYVFKAEVTTSVGCPHCGSTQAW
jgi:hypothetical protein